MIKTWYYAMKIKTAYFVNGFIYSLKSFPLIGKHLPNSLYKNRGMKGVCYLISLLKELASIFLFKWLYLGFFILPLVSFMPSNKEISFLTIFVFFTLIGAFLNTSMFNPTKDKYYAMFSLRMDAKKYVLADYFYFILKTIVGLLPFTILFGSGLGVPLYISVLLPIFVVLLKNCMNAFHLYDYTRTKRIRNENKFTTFVFIAVLLLALLGLGLPYLGYGINEMAFLVIFVILGLINLKVFPYIYHYPNYYNSYKRLYSDYNITVNNQNTNEAQQNMYLKTIEMDHSQSSTKKGYAYFNELFIHRHQKILTRATQKICLAILIIFIIILFITLMSPEVKKKLNAVLLMYLPYFLIIMYALNRGQQVTQAMFMNCDHSMLTYNFYRQPKVILDLFKERLKTLIIINLRPAVLIAFSLVILLAVSGGTRQPMDYVVLFTSIIAMSVFFSIHHLVLYYLLQPYNVSLEMKSSTYGIANMITYFICYFTFQLKMPIMTYGLIVIIFTVLYSLIALYLAYTKASKTFKLRP